MNEKAANVLLPDVYDLFFLFYKQKTGFSMDVGAKHRVDFDYSIVMPHFIPEYKPVGKGATYQHAFHLAELTSGYVFVKEPIAKLNKDIYNKYVSNIEKMAKENGLAGMYKYPCRPAGFVW